MIARDYFAQKERCIYRDVLRQELRQGKRLVAENEDFVAFAPFASRFPFELVVIPKEHSSAFSQMSQGQVESLSRILRDGVAGRVYPGRISYKVDPPSAALSSRLACATATVPGLPPSSPTRSRVAPDSTSTSQITSCNRFSRLPSTSSLIFSTVNIHNVGRKL